MALKQDALFQGQDEIGIAPAKVQQLGGASFPGPWKKLSKEPNMIPQYEANPVVPLF